MEGNICAIYNIELLEQTQWSMLHTLHAEVHIFAIYDEYVAPPTKSMS